MSKDITIDLPSTEEMAAAAVHLGHKTSKRIPQMEPYIQGIKNTIHIIDLEKTREKLKEALQFIQEKVKQGEQVLFVGTKPSAKRIVEKYAKETGSPYVIERWLGGTLTNFEAIKKQIDKLRGMRRDKKEGKWEKYTKKEALEMEKELQRLERLFGGLAFLEKKPTLLYIVDLVAEKTAVREIGQTGILAVGMVDTNANPEDISYPIPANDDATKSIELITGLVAKAIKQAKAGKAAQPAKKKESKTGEKK